MSDIFDPIEISWAGKTYRIASRQVLEVVCLVEETITLHELSQAAERGTAPMGKLAKAFASVLRFAGAPVGDEEVFAAMFTPSTRDQVSLSIKTMLMMLLPRDTLALYQGTKTSGNASGGAGKSSRKRSKRQPKVGGSLPTSSGASAPSSFGGLSKRINQ